MIRKIRGIGGKNRTKIIFIIMFAVGGIILLYATRAATPTAHFEAESGTPSGPAKQVADNSASGGNFLQFGDDTAVTFTQARIDQAMTEARQARLNNQWVNQACFDYDTSYSTSSSTMGASAGMYYLALVAHEKPDAKNSANELVADVVADCIHHFLSAGKDPPLQGLYGWSTPLALGTLALAKHTPAVWNQVSAGDKTRADWLMRTGAVVGNFVNNAGHNCKLVISLDRPGGYLPNQRGYAAVMSYAYMYFGGAQQVNTILSEFDFSKYIAKFDEYGWNRNKWYWLVNANTRKMMEGTLTSHSYNGVTCTVTSSGVRRPFTLKGRIVSNPTNGNRTESLTPVAYQPYQLFKREEVQFMYGNNVVNKSVNSYKSSDCLGHYGNIIGANSKYTGQLGMAHEFNSIEGRSSGHYVTAGQRISMPHYAAIVALGYWPKTTESASLSAQVWRANEHLYYEAMKQGWVAADGQGRCGETQNEAMFTVWRSGYSFIKDIHDSMFRAKLLP